MSAPLVRLARAEDVPVIVQMVGQLAQGHPSGAEARTTSAFTTAYFGADPTGHLLVVERSRRVVGMLEWVRIFDMFWAQYGAQLDWLYVEARSRRIGLPAALVASACAHAKAQGASFARGRSSDTTESALRRFAFVEPRTREFHISGRAFQALARLADSPPREIVRQLPPPSANFEP